MMEQLVEESEHDLAYPTRAHRKSSVSPKTERGAILVELLIALTVIAVLAAMAAPSIVGLQMAANNSFAWNTVSTVYFTGKALAVCNSYQNSCPQLVMPSDGTWQQAGYTYTYSSSGGGGGSGSGGDTGGSATLPAGGVTLASLKLQTGGGGSGGSGSGSGGSGSGGSGSGGSGSGSGGSGSGSGGSGSGSGSGGSGSGSGGSGSGSGGSGSGGSGSGSGSGGSSTGSNNWSFTATPIVYGVTGIHSYSASLSGIVQTN